MQQKTLTKSHKIIIEIQLTFTCSKSTTEAIETCSGVFIIDFEHVSHLFLVFLLLTLNK